MKARRERLPDWLGRPIPAPGRRRAVASALARGGLETVCENAQCPNLGECYGAGTATFMILGNRCTRACRFCAVAHGEPQVPDGAEPRAVARAVSEMGLQYAVVTSVTRDDLADDGAAQFAATVRAIRDERPECKVEVLTPDFAGSRVAVETVVSARPHIFNHNVETVPRLYDRVRPGAAFDRSVGLLASAKELDGSMKTKSGLMVGLGETREEVLEVLSRLRSVACDGVTIGQYLAPSGCVPVARYVPPEEFADLEATARDMGFAMVAAGPLVRSSYHAAELSNGALSVRPSG